MQQVPNIEISSETDPLLPTSFPTLPESPLEQNKHSYEELLKTAIIRLKYYVPVFGWLPKYKMEDLPSDILAGLTVSFIIIPQGLSYAQALVNVPPIFGLYTCIVSCIIYSLLGTSKQMSVGPEALVSIMVGSAIKEFLKWRDAAEITKIDPISNVQPTALLCLMIGLFTLSLGFFRLGFLDSVLSRALLRGFILAVAIVVMIDMSDVLFGMIPPNNQCGQSDFYNVLNDNIERSPIQELFHIISNLSNAHQLTTILSFFSISFLLGVKYLKAKYPKLQGVPEILVLVVITTFLTWMFRWDCQGLAILNKITVSEDQKKAPVLPLPTLPKIKHLLLTAILVSVIGFVESLAVVKTYAAKHDYAISPNRELVAMGTANFISSFFGCFPAFGSLGRSALNNAAGAKTQMAGFFAGLFVWIVTLWLLPLFEFLPRAVCSSIIVVAALQLIELEDVHFIVRLGAWKDLGLLLLTFCSTLFISIETGTLLSVGASLLLVVKHTTKTRIALLGQTTVLDNAGMPKVKYREYEQGHVERIGGCLIVRFEEGLYFGNCGELKGRLKRIELHGDLNIHPSEEPISRSPEHQMPPLRTIIFEMSAVRTIDATATLTMLELVQGYQARDIQVFFVKLREPCRRAFIRSGIVDLLPRNFYSKIKDALQATQPGSSNETTGRSHVDPFALKIVDMPFRRRRHGDEDVVDIVSDLSDLSDSDSIY